jgi:hypothetical protein
MPTLPEDKSINLLTKSFILKKVYKPNDYLRGLSPPESNSDAAAKRRRLEELPGDI